MEKGMGRDYTILTPPNFKNTFDIKFAHPGHYAVRVANKAANIVGSPLVIDVDPIECNRTLGEETSKTDLFVCSCGVGLYLTDRGKCKQCGDDEFSNKLNDECLACPKGSATAVEKKGQLHVNISDCSCNEPTKTFLETTSPFTGQCACRAGYRGQEATLSTAPTGSTDGIKSVCVPCDAGTFSADGDQACTTCSIHMVLKRGAQWRLPGDEPTAAGRLSLRDDGDHVNSTTASSLAVEHALVEDCRIMPQLHCHPCECDAGYYLAPKNSVSIGNATTSSYCRACPVHGDCPRGTTGIENVRVKPGHWRATRYSSSIYKCAIPSNNVGSANLLTNCLGGEHSTCAPVFPVDVVNALDAARAPSSQGGGRFKYESVFQGLAGANLYRDDEHGNTRTAGDRGNIVSTPTRSGGSGDGALALFDNPRKVAAWKQCTAAETRLTRFSKAVERRNVSTNDWRCPPFGPLELLPPAQQEKDAKATKEQANNVVVRATTHAFQCVGAELTQTGWNDDELATHPCTRHAMGTNMKNDTSAAKLTYTGDTDTPSVELRTLMRGIMQAQTTPQPRWFESGVVNSSFDNKTRPGLFYQDIFCGVCPFGAGMGVDGRSCSLCLDSHQNNGFVALVGVVGVFAVMVVVWMELRTTQAAEKKPITMDERSLGQLRYDQYIHGTKTGAPSDQAEALAVLFRIAVSYTQVVSFIIGVESIEWPEMVRVTRTCETC